MGSLFSCVGIIIMLIMSVSEVMCTHHRIGPCEEKEWSYKDILELILNFQYANADYFLSGATGNGLDFYDPSLAGGGPSPTGSQRANLDPMFRRIIEEFGFQKIGQIRENRKRIGRGASPRPRINLEPEVFGELFDKIFGFLLVPQFNPYINPINFALASYYLTSFGLNGLVGVTALPSTSSGQRLFIGQVLAMEAGQKDIIRYFLYQRANQRVAPYNITVSEFTNRTSEFLNRVGKCGLKYEGIEVPRSLGAENRTESNVIDANVNSLAHATTTREVLRVAYGTGNADEPGAFFPDGANGDIARDYIRERNA